MGPHSRLSRTRLTLSGAIGDTDASTTGARATRVAKVGTGATAAIGAALFAGTVGNAARAFDTDASRAGAGAAAAIVGASTACSAIALGDAGFAGGAGVGEKALALAGLFEAVAVTIAVVRTGIGDQVALAIEFVAGFVAGGAGVADVASRVLLEVVGTDINVAAALLFEDERVDGAARVAAHPQAVGLGHHKAIGTKITVVADIARQAAAPTALLQRKQL